MTKRNNPFRLNKLPQRLYTGPVLTPYRKYKKPLRTDFGKRCGYTDCPDFWFGGPSNFHIDHFAPKSKFPEWAENYQNLVYACAPVNRAKSDDWVSNEKDKPINNKKGYLDPCKHDYNDHFERDTQGNIVAKKDSPIAQYMFKKLKLYLKRYGIIWTLDRIYTRMKELKGRIDAEDDPVRKNELHATIGELSVEFMAYLEYLEIELDD